MTTLLLKFAGPLQSWGIRSYFETRTTERYPSKSAVVGMIAASLAYLRDDERVLKLNQLSFAVRIDQPGKLLNDYQIAQKTKPNGSKDQVYVTNRHYMQDAVFVVAIGSDNDDFIQSIEYSLKNPYFQPYLGRRSNPLNVDFFLGRYEADVINSLKNLEWQASDWYKRKNKNISTLSVYADAHLIKNSSKKMVRDQVTTFSQKERKYGYRPMSKCVIAIKDKDIEEHDAYNAF